MRRKGICQEVCSRLLNLYKSNFSIIVVNNTHGKCVENIRLAIRQGDKISMEIFTFGIDPVLEYLEKRLLGILIWFVSPRAYIWEVRDVTQLKLQINDS